MVGRRLVRRTAHVNKSEDNGRMQRFLDRVTETMSDHPRWCLQGGADAEIRQQCGFEKRAVGELGA